MIAYTLGPWEIIQLPSMEYRINAKVGPLNVCPAIAHGIADASLIAAAPDMYEALVSLDTYWSKFYLGPDDRSLRPEITNIWRNIRAAIAKARGETR